ATLLNPSGCPFVPASNLRFGYNGNYCRFNDGSTSRPVWSMAALARPAETAAFSDGVLMCNFDSPIYDPGSRTSYPAGGAQPPRHQEGVNAACADGHAKYQKAMPGTFRGQQRWAVANGPYRLSARLRGAVRAG